MAVVLAAAAAALLVVAAVIGPDNASMALRLAYLVAIWTGPLFLLAALVWSVRRRLESLLSDRLLDLANPAIIRAMAPRTVLGSLLPWIYGDGTDHQEVLTGILGGAGRDIAGRDTAVSRDTTAHFRLWAVDHAVCASESTWTHEFAGVRKSHKFVVFATHDEDIAAAVAQERTFPLFELWQVAGEEQLDEFVRTLSTNVEVGIRYMEIGGTKHVVAPRALPGDEIPLAKFDQYLRLPDAIDRKDLCIVSFDLWDLADPDHVVMSIESLTIKARSRFDLDLGFFTWSPPHPCYVSAVTFDVADLPGAGIRFVYRVVPFTLRKGALHLHEWEEVHDRIVLQIDSWMLPGHGVTLLWRATG